MADITQLILDDHEWFREQFAALDELQARNADADALRTVWDPLSAHLDLHAVAEEEIFYPQLLKRGEDPEEETLDAIDDHNDIRDGAHDADRHPVGSDEWWQAVGRARVANDDHMAEEEREGLADFRLNAPIGLRESLGKHFAEFLEAHKGARGVDTSDKPPQEYVREVEAEINPAAGGGEDTSLGIGSLKRR
ncbi:MAG: hemerythrin domain-containing protein [Streptosporangiales bacterium]